MKKQFTILLAALSLLCSCEPTGISITDNSFNFVAKSSANGTQNYIHLTLESGCKDADYEVIYLIDDDPTLVLTDERSTAFPSGSRVEFKSGIAIWQLPVLRKGEHSIIFTIRTDEYEQVLKYPFNISSEPFAIHAEVKTDLSAGTSTLLLSLAEGIADKEYTGHVFVDDEDIDKRGFTVNFRTTPILSVIIPLVRPGSHTITVKIEDEYSKEEVSFLYEEPLRYPDMQVEIDRSSSTGKTRFMVRSNPYGLSVAVKDSLVVRGRCDYHVCSVYEDRIENKTAYKELCDVVELDRFVPVVGKWYNLTDTQSKEDIITSQSIANTTWKSEWSNSGEGGFEYWQVQDGYSYYKIESSTHNMTIDFEILLGVTVHVTNGERDVRINGTSIGKTYDYKLSTSSR